MTISKEILDMINSKIPENYRPEAEYIADMARVEGVRSTTRHWQEVILLGIATTDGLELKKNLNKLVELTSE